VIDRLTREVAVAIYFLSFITAVQHNSYLALLASIYLMSSYPAQDDKLIGLFSIL
jgi:hypothetical protein